MKNCWSHGEIFSTVHYLNKHYLTTNQSREKINGRGGLTGIRKPKEL